MAQELHPKTIIRIINLNPHLPGGGAGHEREKAHLNMTEMMTLTLSGIHVQGRVRWIDNRALEVLGLNRHPVPDHTLQRVIGLMHILILRQKRLLLRIQQETWPERAFCQAKEASLNLKQT